MTTGRVTGMPLTAKDFRTWGGTHYAGRFLAQTEEQATEKKRKQQINRMVKHVSGKLGNTPAVCRSSYIHPRIIDDCMEGVFHENWDLASRAAKRNGPGLTLMS